MAGDPGMAAQLGDGRTARASHEVHVDLMGGQRFGVILHPGTAPRSPRTTTATRIDSRSRIEEPNIPRPALPSGEPRRRLTIAVGHTAGHVYPALAVADACRAAFPDVQVRFAGTTDGPAGRLLASRGLPLDPVLSAPFGNVRTVGRLAAVPRIVTGTVQARRLLVASGSRLVLGLGGYASGPVLLAGRSLGLRLAIHEANAVPGIANRLLAPLVHRIYSAAPPWRPRSRPAAGSSPATRCAPTSPSWARCRACRPSATGRCACSS